VAASTHCLIVPAPFFPSAETSSDHKPGLRLSDVTGDALADEQIVRSKPAATMRVNILFLLYASLFLRTIFEADSKMLPHPQQRRKVN
jgi:hypothetical protein